MFPGPVATNFSTSALKLKPASVCVLKLAVDVPLLQHIWPCKVARNAAAALLQTTRRAIAGQPVLTLDSRQCLIFG